MCECVDVVKCAREGCKCLCHPRNAETRRRLVSVLALRETSTSTEDWLRYENRAAGLRPLVAEEIDATHPEVVALADTYRSEA